MAIGSDSATLSGGIHRLSRLKNRSRCATPEPVVRSVAMDRQPRSISKHPETPRQRQLHWCCVNLYVWTESESTPRSETRNGNPKGGEGQW